MRISDWSSDVCSSDLEEGSALSGVTDQHQLFFHKLETTQSEDALIFGGSGTPRRYIGGYLTEDERFLVISAANTTSGGELYIQDLSKPGSPIRSEEHTSELQSLMRISSAVFCLKKK